MDLSRNQGVEHALMFVDLARRLPALSFTLIGPNFKDEQPLCQAVEAAEVDLFQQGTVVIPAANWKKFEAWVNEPARNVPALRNLARTRPAWRG